MFKNIFVLGFQIFLIFILFAKKKKNAFYAGKTVGLLLALFIDTLSFFFLFTIKLHNLVDV